jgi:hypothetical protein
MNQLEEHLSDAYIREMDKRLVILETRFDTVLPTLATKADLAALEQRLTKEIHSAMSRMSLWLAGTCIALILGFGAMSLSMFTTMQTIPQLLKQAIAVQ